MRSKSQQQQSSRRIRRERRRLGRFVFFSEIEADLTPVLLFDQLRHRQARLRLTKRNRADPETTETHRRCPAEHDYPAASPARPASATPAARCRLIRK